MSSKGTAKKHSMDIPHVAAVELPLVVKNEERAISMIGGKSKISNAINNSYIQNHPASGSSIVPDENILELRLRNDPFHHPLQSLVTNRERVLLKVSIPKKSLPKDYYEDPSKYTIQELIEENKNKNGPNHKVLPVAIINKTFSFKTMTDFQVLTKNNTLVQEFNDLTGSKAYDDVSKYFNNHSNMTDISDYKEPSSYENKDHQLPPPPVFSNVRLPFSYKYQRNPYTLVLKDENGETKLVQKKNDRKIHTKIIEFNELDVPKEPAPELIEKYESLMKSDLSLDESSKTLIQCIHWLKKLFDIKPFWLRKHLKDILPPQFTRYLKPALPFVTYIYKSGPWRFCHVKYGVDPKYDKKNWKYQIEYFRVASLSFDAHKQRKSERILPLTIKEKDPRSDLKVSDYLLFTGYKLPQTITYQLGDMIDEDILDVVSNTPETKFFRDVIDFQDGWINKQTIETIRRIVRYKLAQLVKDEPVDPARISKIVNQDYVENNDDMEVDLDNASKDIEQEEQDDPDEQDDDQDQGQDDQTTQDIQDQDDLNISEDNVMSRIDKLDPETAYKLKDLVSFVKQDSLA